jgi:hypothetical protein
MKKLLLLVPTLLLTGCLTTAPKFPDLPSEISQTCPELKEAEKSPDMSKLLDTVVQNYGTYYECRVKIDAFIEWHKSQKKVYDNAVKK